MARVSIFSGALLVVSALAARAADAPAPVPSPLPTFALAPAPTSTRQSPWTGFYVGSEVFAVSRKGAKGLVGGGVYAGYNHEFANRVVLGVQAGTGFAPYSFSRSPLKGFDYATANVKVGYDMGRWMPYVTTGVVLTKPVGTPGPGYVSAADSASDLFNSSHDVKAAATVGAGVDYAVTSNLRVGVSASVGNTRGLLAAPGW
jgi:opacity protein-like surface antigen